MTNSIELYNTIVTINTIITYPSKPYNFSSKSTIANIVRLITKTRSRPNNCKFKARSQHLKSNLRGRQSFIGHPVYLIFESLLYIYL